MANPVITALEADAQAQNPPISGAQWLWQQAGLVQAANMKLGDMTRVIEFINGRVKARGNKVVSEIRTATSPFLWPFSDASAAILYPDENNDERAEIRASQMQEAVEALRAFVLGDILNQAGDERASRYLGDPKVSGSKGEAALNLESAKDAAAAALQALGARKDTSTGNGGENFSLATHYTRPTYPNGYPS